MNEFYQRLYENFVEAKEHCTSGKPKAMLSVRADDFCVIHHILYTCFKEEVARQSRQAVENKKAVWQ